MHALFKAARLELIEQRYEFLKAHGTRLEVRVSHAQPPTSAKPRIPKALAEPKSLTCKCGAPREPYQHRCLSCKRDRGLLIAAMAQQRQQEERQRRVAGGFCRECRQPGRLGSLYCEGCLAKLRERRKKIYAVRKAEGLCTRCDDMAQPNRSRCAAHLPKQKASEGHPALAGAVNGS